MSAQKCNINCSLVHHSLPLFAAQFWFRLTTWPVIVQPLPDVTSLCFLSLSLKRGGRGIARMYVDDNMFRAGLGRQKGYRAQRPDNAVL